VIQRWNSEFGLGDDISDLEEDKDDGACTIVLNPRSSVANFVPRKGIDWSTEASEEHRSQGHIRVRKARSQKMTFSVAKQTAAKESKQRSKRMKTVKSKDKKHVNAANGVSIRQKLCMDQGKGEGQSGTTAGGGALEWLRQFAWQAPDKGSNPPRPMRSRSRFSFSSFFLNSCF
jgi:hypothetical protein